MAPEGTSEPIADEERLAELGYKQELSRSWSSFTNFAISFTIISILAGTFTNFSFAWQNGGPAGIAFGWPIICALIMMVGFSMAELTSAYPTAGGPYWWANELGGKGWSWMTGWFNIVGLVGVVAGVGYGTAIFLNFLLSLYSVDIFGVNFADTQHVLGETFGLFVLILAVFTMLNVFADRALALVNNISVGWHLLGVAIVIGLLIFVPDHHQSADFVFTQTINNNGAFGGSTTALGFWLLVVPVGFILTMYTETGYDASAHTAEETRGAALAAAQGIWRAIFRRVNRDRVPFNGVIAVAVFALIISIPALFGKNNIPFAFFAITGICTVGLYIAYIIPIYLRLRAGDRFTPGPWTLGSRYKVVNSIALFFGVLMVFALDLPYTPTGLPWKDGFDATVVNYTPLAIVIPLVFGVWYLISAKNKYQGPVRTLEEDEVTRDV